MEPLRLECDGSCLGRIAGRNARFCAHTAFPLRCADMDADVDRADSVPRARCEVRTSASLGVALREMRYLQGWTQQELADAIGVSRRYIWRLERARPTQHLERLIEAFAAVGARLVVEEVARLDSGGPPSTEPPGGAG